MTLLTLVAAAGWLKPDDALAQSWNKAAFDTKNMADTMKALGGGEPAQSKDIVFFQTPDIAENGAVVPVGITSNIPEDRIDRGADREESRTCWRRCSTFRRAPSRRSRRA